MESSIALVGMDCHFAGNIHTPESLWQLVHDGKDVIGDVPADRGWNISGLYDPDPASPGKFYAKNGYFLRDPYGFDAGFFGISPKEARATDPQQRIVLELAWRALERAGIAPLSLRGTRSGVFIGCSPSSYYTLSQDPGRAEAFGSYWGVGTASSMMSGRIPHALGLEGPAISIDTGCSSALVALHLACQSLRLGECDLALAGGVMVMTSPDPLIFFSAQRALAPDGRCKPFAANADGTSFADGAGMLVAERLSDARRLGHPVLAVVKGTALSQDGSTSDGLTAPSVHAQVRVIRSALRNAGLGPADVDAVEAHGTGTTVGDPIEARALIEAYGQGRQEGDPLWVGSLKANIGHTQSAAGMAGIIKMVQAMRHGELPKTLHVDKPTPEIDWERGGIRLLTESIRWPERGHPRRAGISSFGISGTNAHVIIEEPSHAARRRAAAGNPGAPRARAAGRVPSAIPFLLSAKTAPALRDQARQLAEHVTGRGLGDGDMAGIGHALVTTRSLFDHRAVILASGRDELCSRLTAFAAGEAGRGVIADRARHPSGKVVFVFPGQGGQWPGMAKRLIGESRVFAEKLAACDEALAPHVDWSLMRVLKRGPVQAAVDRLDMVQPMLFAIAVALAALWRSMGVEPEAVVGHSQGEIAAAHVCGALSLDAAARISALRARALSELAGTGAMVSLPLSAADTKRLLSGQGEEIEIAVANGPTSTIVAGASDAMDRFTRALAADGVEWKRVPVDYASHSAQVERVRDSIPRALAGISASSSDVPFYSTVVGGPIDTSGLDAAYWWENLRRPVLFADTVQVLGNDGFRTFVEASPHPVLASAISETIDGMLPESETATVVGSLRRDRGGRVQFLTEVAKAHVAGVPVDWTGCFGRRPRGHVDLPTYPFQREQYRLDQSAAGAAIPGAPPPENLDSPFDDAGDLFLLDWAPAPDHRDAALPDRMAIIGPPAGPLACLTRESGSPRAPDREVRRYPTLDELLKSVGAGAAAPDVVLASPPAPDRDPAPGRDPAPDRDPALGLDPAPGRDPAAATVRDTHAAAAWALETARKWLGEERLSGARLVILTRQAVACDPGDPVSGLAEAAIWGLIRSAQSEHPGRLILLDSDTADVPPQALSRALAAALTSGEPQLAIRGGAVRVPRLVPAGQDDHEAAALTPPEDPAWRLVSTPLGGMDAMALDPAPDLARPLGPLDVRMAVRACGLKSPDAATAIGKYPGEASFGGEVAGVVVAAGPGVRNVKAGDRVMGLADGDAGSYAVTDARRLVRVPPGWTFSQAAGAPVAFLTAYYALRHLARVRPGDKVLIHTAADGVGMAAVRIAGCLGADVFATANPDRWPALAAAGVPADHITSPRTPEFDMAFLRAIGEPGVDAVLDPLRGESANSSIRLLRERGRFVTTGNKGRLSTADPAAQSPGIEYREFDLAELPPERVGPMLADLVRMLEEHHVPPLPTRAWDIRHARDAFVFARDTRRGDKVVLTTPVRPDADGTFLITGGTGSLGGQIARHLAAERGARHLLLASRRGDQAPGARDLADELRKLGAEVRIASCDVTDPDAVRSLVASIPAEHPLTCVVHSVGTLDNCVLPDMTRERLDAVLSPKVDAAWNLYQATRQLDLSDFILFSSVAALHGFPGQGNYAAANAFLDSFAAHLRGQGMPAAAIAWGTWAARSGLIDLTPADYARLSRNEGMAPLDPGRALTLFGQTARIANPYMVLNRLDPESLRAQAAGRTLSPLLSRLVPETPAEGAWVADMIPAARRAPDKTRLDVDSVLDLIRTQTAIILGYPDPRAVDVIYSFRDLGFDSVSSLELMQRLSRSVEVNLPARLLREYATPTALATALLQRVRQESGDWLGGGEASPVQEIAASRDYAPPPLQEVGR